MRVLISILVAISFTQVTSGQIDFSGKWQGAVIRKGQTLEQATLLYTEFTVDGTSLRGHSREEKYNTEEFAVKQLSGKVDEENVTFKQVVVQKSSKSSRTKWCRYDANLSYNEATGYLTGKYVSTDCKRVIGTIILFRADFELSKTETPGTGYLWFEQFIKDRKEGLSAPEIRKVERDNFVFEPVFFDFDQSDIRDEHIAFLERMIKVVKGHSDLRVKMVGHTDSDGSNAYNDGLSKRRAEAIVAFFVQRGLKADRLEFDFKGETQPVDTNATREGKQRNRRVDFSFI